MVDRLEITKNWLPRYTGMPLDKLGDYILLTNFQYYLVKFAEKFNCEIFGEDKPMAAATNNNGLTIINFGIGSANAATIMDLLSACAPKGVLFLVRQAKLGASCRVQVPVGRVISMLARKGLTTHPYRVLRLWRTALRRVGTL